MNNKNALLIIDMQQEDGFPLENFEGVIAQNLALLTAARRGSIPVFYTRHINQADGVGLAPGEPRSDDGGPSSYRAGTAQVEIIPALAPLADEQVIDKHRYSGFHQTDLDARLKQRGVDTLIISGVLTDVCVLTTVFDAFALGYRIQLITDACTASTLAAHYSALLIMANWVYAIELFNCEQFLLSLDGEPFACCAPGQPDQFAHQPEALPNTIVRLQSSLQRQE
jgi:nicotinamidase-related amidase